MCKHILIREFKIEDLDIVRDFADRSYDRDGYGAIIRDRKGDLWTLKSVSQGAFYLDLTRFLMDTDISELVVHHRTSTNGSGVDYAHPFEYKGHYLTHNGVVTVPDKHDTTTSNDSEALLHHLIKTRYDTKTIQGYFSCFVLNHETTTVLVDDTAPIYTDGRVYCSHALSGLSKIELQRITYDRSGASITEAIQVTKTSYGSDKAYLSLGLGKYSESYSQDYSTYAYDDNYYYKNNVDAFFNLLTAYDERQITDHYDNPKKMKKIVRSIAANCLVTLNEEEVETIISMV